MATSKGLPIALLVAVALLALASPANAFKSGGWDGQANHEDNGSFRDCTIGIIAKRPRSLHSPRRGIHMTVAITEAAAPHRDSTSKLASVGILRRGARSGQHRRCGRLPSAVPYCKTTPDTGL